MTLSGKVALETYDDQLLRSLYHEAQSYNNSESSYV